MARSSCWQKCGKCDLVHILSAALRGTKVNRIPSNEADRVKGERKMNRYLSYPLALLATLCLTAGVEGQAKDVQPSSGVSVSEKLSSIRQNVSNMRVSSAKTISESLNFGEIVSRDIGEIVKITTI
jgi:hypothetical protein